MQSFQLKTIDIFFLGIELLCFLCHRYCSHQLQIAGRWNTLEQQQRQRVDYFLNISLFIKKVTRMHRPGGMIQCDSF